MKNTKWTVRKGHAENSSMYLDGTVDGKLVAKMAVSGVFLIVGEYNVMYLDKYFRNWILPSDEESALFELEFGVVYPSVAEISTLLETRGD